MIKRLAATMDSPGNSQERDRKGHSARGAPLPPNERARLYVLRAFEILDTPIEPDFDDFTDLAAQLCDTPMALITLVDEKRQWFKSRRGFGLTETARELSFCAHTILGSDVFEVCDATRDPRFADNPLVTSGQIRFYAGAPLVTTERHHLGSLSVLDTRPRQLDGQQKLLLMALARQVMRQIELRRSSRRLEQLARARSLEAAIGVRLAAGDDLARLLEHCATQLAEHCETAVVIWIQDPESGEWRDAARATSSAVPPAVNAVAETSGRQKLEAVLAAQKTVVVPRRTSGSSGETPSVPEEPTAFAGFPLRVQRDSLGVLALFGSRDFSPEDVDALASIAVTLALAIDSRRSEERLRRLNQELERRVGERTQALLENERRHRTLLSNLPGLAYRCRNDRNWPCDFISEGARTLLGIAPETITSGTVHLGDLIHPDDAEQVWQTVQQGLELHKPFALEYRIRRADGQWRWVWEHGRGIEDASGHIEYIEGFIVDVTERKQSERQVLRTQRLESLGTLAGGVAHDLNNALAPILMGLELLRLQSDKSQPLVDTMMASARRGADMVRQLLMFARGAEGARRPVHPRQLISELEQIIRGTFPKNIELHFHAATNVHAVLGDPTQLHQVLLNLCVNARDAMPDGGRLSLEVENIHIDTAFASSVVDARAGYYVVWRVSDTGTGIPPEMLERIFEPFFTTKTPDKGTGLGLSTVLGIVRGHGGFVRVDSTPGRGSTFSVYLPASEGARIDPVVSQTDSFRGNGEAVLVIDDEPAVRHVSQSVLTALNFKVVLAADGTEALLRAAACQDELRAVITDLHMPHMDGLTFVRVIKQMLPQTGIIVASGRLEPRAEAEFASLGVSAVLHKPFTQDQLVTALRAALASSGRRGDADPAS